MIEGISRSRIPAPLTTVVRSLLRKLSMHGKVNHFPDLRVGRGAIIGSTHGLSIGRGVAIGPRTVVQVNGVIGDFALIGMHVQIIGREDHEMTEIGVPMARSTWIGDRAARPRDSVDIGRDVWIGASSVILGGIAIGQGSVVGAGSVVTRDIPEYSIVVGNPARVIGRRFENEADRMRHTAILDERLLNSVESAKPL